MIGISRQQLVFGFKNVLDKLKKSASDPKVFKYYLRTYVFARAEALKVDVYVVSYPKSGKTWLTFFLKAYLKELGLPLVPVRNSFAVTPEHAPTVVFTHDCSNWVPAPRAKGAMKVSLKRYRGAKVVFLYRDPRDVAVSSWHHLTARENIFKEDLSALVRSPLVGVEKIVDFMNLWAEAGPRLDRFMTLTYEEMRREPRKTLEGLLDFIGYPVDGDALDRAIEASSFRRMSRMEAEDNHDQPWLRKGTAGNLSSQKVRKGKVGGYVDEMTPEDVAWSNRVIAEQLSRKYPYHG